jgi:hypothetical protein
MRKYVTNIFLLVFDCHFEAFEGASFSRLPDLKMLIRIVIEHHVQLVGSASVVHQRGGKRLALLAQILQTNKNVKAPSLYNANATGSKASRFLRTLFSRWATCVIFWYKGEVV